MLPVSDDESVVTVKQGRCLGVYCPARKEEAVKSEYFVRKIAVATRHWSASVQIEYSMLPIFISCEYFGVEVDMVSKTRWETENRCASDRCVICRVAGLCIVRKLRDARESGTFHFDRGQQW